MTHKPTAAELFEKTRIGVLERVVARQKQQISELKQAVLDSVQKERSARRRLYEIEGAALVKKSEEVGT